MLRRITLTLALLALVGFGLAQTIVPTTGSGADDVGVAFGASGNIVATVSQDVNLHIPPVVALHLDVTELTFNIADVGEYGDDWVCVYGAGFRDTDAPGGVFNSQNQVLPLGTSYQTGTWPNITIQSHGGVVGQYPPIIIQQSGDDEGELVDGSKNYFVCYRTFILQKFSTIPGWQLHASRTGGTFDMYIQDNTCADFGQPTGLYKISDQGARVNLLPPTLTGKTTGALAAGSSCGGKSWLDDLVVVAVKVNGEAAGDNIATLTYSLSATVPTNYTAP